MVLFTLTQTRTKSSTFRLRQTSVSLGNAGNVTAITSTMNLKHEKGINCLSYTFG